MLTGLISFKAQIVAVPGSMMRTQCFDRYSYGSFRMNIAFHLMHVLYSMDPHSIEQEDGLWITNRGGNGRFLISNHKYFMDRYTYPHGSIHFCVTRKSLTLTSYTMIQA